MYKQLLLDIVDVMDQDVVDAYQQMSQKTVQRICEQSDNNQYEFILQIVAYLNRIKTLFEEQLEEHINNDYETIIQNLEASIRSHIRVQQQQKLQIESLMQKIEEVTQEKDLIIKSQQDKIKSQEQIIKQEQKLQAGSPVEIIHKKTTSAFERLSKLVSNQSQKSLQNSINEAHFKALIKICNTEKDHSVSKCRRQFSAKRETGQIRTNEDIQNLEPKPLETERLRDTIMEKRHRVQKSEKFTEQQQQSLSTDKLKNKYKGPIRGSPLLKPEQTQQSSQSFDHVGKNLMALKRQQTNSRLQYTQSSKNEYKEVIKFFAHYNNEPYFLAQAFPPHKDFNQVAQAKVSKSAFGMYQSSTTQTI